MQALYSQVLGKEKEKRWHSSHDQKTPKLHWQTLTCKVTKKNRSNKLQFQVITLTTETSLSSYQLLYCITTSVISQEHWCGFLTQHTSLLQKQLSYQQHMSSLSPSSSSLQIAILIQISTTTMTIITITFIIADFAIIIINSCQQEKITA